MPPRPPPSPPVLTVLCCLAAAGGAWLCVSLDQLVRAGLGGAGWSGAYLDPARGYTLAAEVPAAATPGAAAAVLVSVAAMLVLSGTLHWWTSQVRSAGWLRGFALVWLVVSLTWLPTSLASAAQSQGGGPVADLYRDLGAPAAGRWAALALACLLLGLVSGPAASRAVATGRAWMRVDGLDFRRRLVRVAAGWPAVVGVLCLALPAGWSRQPVAALWAVAVLAVLQLRTR